MQRGLGAAAWSSLDARFRARTAEVAIAVPEPQAAVPVDQHGAIGDADYRPGSPDVRWAGAIEHERFQVDATITIRRAGADQTDFVFGQTGNAWLRVSFVAGGGVFVLAREQDGDAAGGWQVLARSGKVDRLVVGQPTKVRIGASAGEVRVDVAGKRAVTAKTGKRTFRGRWGMGAPPGSRANWRDLRLVQ